MANLEERYIAAIALLSAFLVASHEQAVPDLPAMFRIHMYWIMRIGVQSLFFFAARSLIEKYWDTLSFAPLTALAVLASHVPFVLSVTAMDIVLGLPELGVAQGGARVQPDVTAFLLETFFLADNHIALCLLLSLPRLGLGRLVSGLNADGIATPEMEVTVEPGTTLLSGVDPPLQGAVTWVEAQEHYVRINTETESRMLLARFSDVVRELSTRPGMQVHRSHWVATDAVVGTQKSGQGISLLLRSGETIPVSRSYRKQVEAMLGTDAAEPPGRSRPAL